MIVCIMKHITGSVSTHNTNLGGFPLHYDVVGAISCGKVISPVLNRPIIIILSVVNLGREWAFASPLNLEIIKTIYTQKKN